MMTLLQNVNSIEANCLFFNSIVGSLRLAMCNASCLADARCFASVAQKLSGTQAHECLIFYHSDTVTKYEHPCGVDVDSGGARLFDARDVCTSGMGVENRWTAKCP